MPLTTPITFTFTEQRVLDFHFDRVNNFIRVKVAMSTAAGIESIHELVIDKYTPLVPAVPAVMADEIVVTPAVPEKPATGGQMQRLTRNVNPRATTTGMPVVFMVETVSTGSNAVYQNAKQALKQTDELAALESAGRADGWLFPGA